MQGVLFQYINRRLFTIGLLGFASGLPLALVGSTLQAWFASKSIGLTAIGLLSFIGQPYIFKFLWAPLFDRFNPPFLDRRRGWLLCTQFGLILTIASMALLDPQSHPAYIASLAFLAAILSASQDIVYDAYRTELLLPDERGLGAAIGIAGYRLGMIFSGGVALLLADYYGWMVTYLLMAAGFLLAMWVTVRGPSVAAVSREHPERIVSALVEPLRDFLQRPQAWGILLFIFLYKLGESFTSTSGSLVTTYLLQELHFTLTTVGLVNKIVGIIATIIGLFIGGGILTRVPLYQALFAFGILQGITNAGFVLLAWVGKSTALLVLTVTLDNLSAGMGLAALIALLMSLCKPAYTATQFALLSAFASLPRIIAGPITALLVEQVGWLWFFVFSVLITLPALWLLIRLQEPLMTPSFILSGNNEIIK